MAMILLNLFTVNFRQLVFLDYEKQKSIACKASHINLLKIPPFSSLAF